MSQEILSKLETLIAGQSAMEQRFIKIDERFDSMDKRLDSMDERFDSMDKRFDLVDERLGNLESETARLNEKSDRNWEYINRLFEDHIIPLNTSSIETKTAVLDLQRRVSKLEEAASS